MSVKQMNMAELIERIGVEISSQEILLTALTHRSYLNEQSPTQSEHNERLEFLGDAVLELIISEYLFITYPDRPEGELTSFRAAIVRTDSLAETSRELRVGEYLLMSRGEEATGGRDKDYLLANAFEAILGAIYRDQGYEMSKKFVYKWLTPKLEEIVENRYDIDAKTKFQEIAQRVYKLTPTYSLISDLGPDHEKTFTMAVFVGDRKFGMGEGTSKQRAEEQAASDALANLTKMDKSIGIA